jgi:hypothetical protein
VGETVRRAGRGIVMIPDAHAWCRLSDRGQQVLRRLYQELTEWRDDLAVVLAGQAVPLRDLLRASPPLAARFPAVIDFPGYTAGQLAAIFATQLATLGLRMIGPRLRGTSRWVPSARPGPAGSGGAGSPLTRRGCWCGLTAMEERAGRAAIRPSHDGPWPATTSTGPAGPSRLCRAAGVPGGCIVSLGGMCRFPGGSGSGSRSAGPCCGIGW